MRDGKLFILVLALLLYSGCHAQESPSLGERLGQAFEKAAKASGAVKDYGTPRQVPKGGKPVLIVKDGHISFNGKSLVLGGPVADWKRTIGAGSVCGGDTLVTVCKWDGIGIEIGSGIKKPNRVEFINIFFNEAPQKSQIKLPEVDIHGKPVPPPWEVTGFFAGYFELEGYGIDRRTKFWEIRASVPRKHDLRCGLRDCSHPLGMLKNDVGIGMVLNRNDEYGELWQLSLNLKNE